MECIFLCSFHLHNDHNNSGREKICHHKRNFFLLLRSPIFANPRLKTEIKGLKDNNDNCKNTFQQQNWKKSSTLLKFRFLHLFIIWDKYAKLEFNNNFTNKDKNFKIILFLLKYFKTCGRGCLTIFFLIFFFVKK